MGQCCAKVRDYGTEKWRRCAGYGATIIDGREYCAIHARKVRSAAHVELSERALQAAIEWRAALSAMDESFAIKLLAFPGCGALGKLSNIAAELAALEVA
jgi:hypothetical protein